MKKKLRIILWVLLICAIIVCSLLWGNKTKNTDNSITPNSGAAQLILFYGATCPHCKAEEWYLDTLKETYDFEIVWYEVY